MSDSNTPQSGSSFSFDKRTPEGAGSSGIRSEAEQQVANREVLDGIKKEAKSKFDAKLGRWKWLWAVRGQFIVGTFFFALGNYTMVYPFFEETFKNIFQYDRPIEAAQVALPTLSTAWWENQWRKGYQNWRAGERGIPGFYNHACDFINECTGKDLRAPFEAFGLDKSKASNSQKLGEAWNRGEIEHARGVRKQEWELQIWEAEQEGERKRLEEIMFERRALNDPYNDAEGKPTVSREIRKVSKFGNDTTRPRALVPMCGDSQIVRELANMGYNVDAIDSSVLAISTLSAESEQALKGWNDEPMHRMHLHQSDIFEPSLWRMLPRRGYDVIWDRQGLSAIDPEAREDYAFVLKRALKPDGVLYVEATYRSKRVHRNRFGGPAFHFGFKELTNLFPLDQGFIVKCEDIKEIQKADLSAEERLTGEIPKRLRVRHYPCAVWKDELRAAEESKRRRAEAF